jgi:hypothetical protein
MLSNTVVAFATLDLAMLDAEVVASQCLLAALHIRMLGVFFSFCRSMSCELQRKF